MEMLGAYGGLLFRVLLCVSILFFLLISLLLLFNRNYGKNVIARFINAANGEAVDISSWEVSLGRAKICDIVLNNPTVSRFHAVVVRRGKGWMIFDTNSKTGITVNGKKIDKKAFIYDGDIISMGTSVLSFRSPLFKRADKKENPPAYRDIPADRRVVAAAKRSSGSAISALVNMADRSLVLLFSEEYIIGRASDCDIVLPVMTVSKHQSRLVKEGSVWRLSDMNSRGGTQLNGLDVIGSVPLRGGDVICAGGIYFKFIENYMSE